MRKLLILMAAVVMVFGTMGVANALTIDWSDLTEGETLVTGDGWTAYGITTGWVNNGVFTTKNYGGVTGVGIGGGNVDGEIDWGEKIRIQFDDPVVISEFTISFLYPAGVEGDYLFETAMIWVGDEWGTGNYVVYTLEEFLTALYGPNAIWSGEGTVEKLSASGGVYTVTNPFGDMEIGWIAFMLPSYNSCNPGSGGSDYSLVSLSTVSAVPIPGAVWLLGSGLVGLVGLRRKFNA